MKAAVKATKDNIVLKIRPAASNSGIVIPEHAESVDKFFEVVDVGPDVKQFRIGDVVAGPATQFSVIAFEHEKVRYVVCKADHILCKIVGG
jgi:co-chaperonin GroES (HSP10)